MERRQPEVVLAERGFAEHQCDVLVVVFPIVIVGDEEVYRLKQSLDEPRMCVA